MNMLNRYDVIKSKIIFISSLIFFASIIICLLSVLLGHQNCPDWDAGNKECWKNNNFHNLYKIGFIFGMITVFPVLYRTLPKFWGFMKSFCRKITEFEYSWQIYIIFLVIYVPFSIYNMIQFPDCYGDDGIDTKLCGEDSFESHMSLLVALGFLPFGIPAIVVFCLILYNFLGRAFSEIGTVNNDEDNKKHQHCSKCGRNKAVKIAIYTPTATWFGATVGMALSGFAGLFIMGFFGGAIGLTKGLDGNSCNNCGKN